MRNRRPEGPNQLQLVREKAERDLLWATLCETSFNVSETGRRLHVCRTEINRLMRKHKIHRPVGDPFAKQHLNFTRRHPQHQMDQA